MDSQQQMMGDWLAGQRQRITQRWLREGKKFPFFAALRIAQLRATVAREFDGLLSFISADQSGLEGATETHRKQADDFLRGAPVDQQVGFLGRRVHAITEILNSDPSSIKFREDFIEKMEHAGRYYKTTIRSIDFEQRFSSLP